MLNINFLKKKMIKFKFSLKKNRIDKRDEPNHRTQNEGIELVWTKSIGGILLYSTNKGF